MTDPATSPLTGPAVLASHPGTGDNLAIETRGLVKRFGRRAAVDGIDLAVPQGAVYGFLGPNGSGKTTTIRLLLGLATANSGDISVLGKEMPQSLTSVLPHVGALVEGPGFYPFLTAEANLMRLDSADRHAPSSTRRQRAHEALDRVGLGHAAGKKVRAYSLGMKQRLGLANAMLRPRELLVLDEPTNGLDPQGTREVRALVRSLAAGGTTVFVSSHLLAEVRDAGGLGDQCLHAAVGLEPPPAALPGRRTQRCVVGVEQPGPGLIAKEGAAVVAEGDLLRVLEVPGKRRVPAASAAAPGAQEADHGRQQCVRSGLLVRSVALGVRGLRCGVEHGVRS